MPHPSQSKTVLLVEDDDLVRDVICAVLEQNGCRVLHAADGEAALDLLTSGPPADVLIADAHLPGAMTGWAVARLFGAVRPGRRVVYISGERFAPVLPVENSIFMSKPFQTTKMLQAVMGLACAP